MSHPTKLAPLVEFDAEPAPSRGRAAKSSGGARKWSVKAWLDSTAGKITVAIGVLLVAVFVTWRTLSFAGVGEGSWQQIRLMNPQTGEMRWLRVGAKTMPDGFYPVEYCFDNECGPAGGTPVVLNVYLGSKEPTHCPKCGALVEAHNRRPPEYANTIPKDQR